MEWPNKIKEQFNSFPIDFQKPASSLGIVLGIAAVTMGSYKLLYKHYNRSNVKPYGESCTEKQIERKSKSDNSLFTKMQTNKKNISTKKADGLNAGGDISSENSIKNINIALLEKQNEFNPLSSNLSNLNNKPFIYYSKSYTQLDNKSMSGLSFITIALTETSVRDAERLAKSVIENTKSNIPLNVLIGENIDKNARIRLQKYYNIFVFNTNDCEKGLLNITTIIHLWTMCNFKKCVYLDSGCTVLDAAVEDLFMFPELSCNFDPFTQGKLGFQVFVFIPSLHTYNELKNIHANDKTLQISSILQKHFTRWTCLPQSSKPIVTFNIPII